MWQLKCLYSHITLTISNWTIFYFFYLGSTNHIARSVMGLADPITAVLYILLGKLGSKSYVVNKWCAHILHVVITIIFMSIW